MTSAFKDGKFPDPISNMRKKRSKRTVVYTPDNSTAEVFQHFFNSEGWNRRKVDAERKRVQSHPYKRCPECHTPIVYAPDNSIGGYLSGRGNPQAEDAGSFGYGDVVCPHCGLVLNRWHIAPDGQVEDDIF